MDKQEITEALVRRAAITEEEAEALQEAARVWAERVQYSIAEVAEALSRVLSAAGWPDVETLDDLRKEIEEIDKKLLAKQRRQARERERAQTMKRKSAARFAQYRRQELKWTAGRRVRPRQREYKPP